MATIPKRVQVRLATGVKKFQSILKIAVEKDINESDTVAIIMDMLAELFGYEKYTEITSEYAIKKTYCDLAIEIDGKTKFLIETKSIGTDLKSEHVRQAVNYGSNKGSDWVILTNGNQWKVFKILFAKPLDYDLIYEFEILNLNYKKESDLEYLYYISKESIGRSALEDYLIERQSLSKYFIGQIIISDPVLDAVKKTLKKVSKDLKVSPDEIKEVLIQDILKREIFEDEKSEDARKRLNRIFKVHSKPKADNITNLDTPMSS